MKAASVIIPAHDEAGYIGPCLEAVFASDLEGTALQVIVVANGCADKTAQKAQDHASSERNLSVIETPQGGKLQALELGDRAAHHGTRIYLDADVIVAPDLISQLVAALAPAAPRYASGTPSVARAQSALTRAYARLWQRLPFVAQGVPGFGIFAVNAAGRARWDVWPDIISDDTFVRLHFAPEERLKVPAHYSWPMVEGWHRLVRVRRRQDRGVAEITARFPHLAQNEGRARMGAGDVVRLALQDPIGFAVYGAVSLAVRLPGPGGWVRGR
ncbi:glycosyltransferase [Roseovarius nanhaiticus]|uniref:glycosyltransferase n=1 Tax=Roseovarius nanhaiticus TaxID=573024 RepID=UPI0024929F05|nr:glycosyltransferase family 2 protein [Roseovarius nanhaiticus]